MCFKKRFVWLSLAVLSFNLKKKKENDMFINSNIFKEKS